MFKALSTHFHAIKDALQDIKSQESAKLDYDNKAFLPAALEVLETPPNPLGRWVLWSILGFLGIALIWAIFGSVDIVAVGEGRVIPRGQVKVIQSADLGVVRELLVKEGQFVKAGEPLIVLNPTISDAEVEQARQALISSEIDLNRAKALANFASGRPANFVIPIGVDPSLVAVQQAYLRQRVDEQNSTLQSLNQERQQRAYEASMIAAESDKLSQQLPLLEERLSGLEALNAKGYAPKTTVNEVKAQLIGIKQDIVVRAAEAQKSRAAYLAVNQAYGTQKSKFAGEALDALTKAEAIFRQRSEELKKSQERARLTTLTSPIDGYAQQLQAHTVGGVVKPAESLMIIVPKSSELMVEAQFPNREIGFIQPDQPVEIKFEAFPFTRYGTAQGRIETINRDATPDEKRGLLYTAQIVINTQPKDANHASGVNSTRSYTDALELDPRRIRPGMSVTVEAKTGRRSIIGYLLSPLARRAQEAGRER